MGASPRLTLRSIWDAALGGHWLEARGRRRMILFWGLRRFITLVESKPGARGKEDRVGGLELEES